MLPRIHPIITYSIPPLLMIPKRKLIKKRFTAPKAQGLTQQQLPENIAEQLQSNDDKIKLDALAAVANLEQIDEQLLTPSILIELLNVLYSGNPQTTHSCLFALVNVCELHPDPTVKVLFGLGLEKAIMQLNSSDPHLVKPMIALMTTICAYIPEKNQFLIKALQNTIITSGLSVHKSSQNPNPLINPQYSDLVLEFLMRTEYSFESPAHPPNQPAIVNTLISIAETHKSYKSRAMASRVLVGLTKANTPEHLDIYCAVAAEIVGDIDLQKQYDMNFCDKPELEEATDKNSPNQIEELMDQQEKPHAAKGKKVVFDENAYAVWLDALEGLQTILEFNLEILDNENNFEDDGADEMEEQDMDEQEEEANTEPWNNAIIQKITHHVLSTCKQYLKLVTLSFVEGQVIIELVLKLILSFPSSATTPDMCNYLANLGETCLVSLFKSEMSSPHKIPIEYFSLNSNLCIQVVLKFKIIFDRSVYISLPTLTYPNGNKILKIEKVWKDCWLGLLQVYSMFFNPEKNPVSELENSNIGAILKQLVIQIPEMELQEWRGQAIDTIFDVYSNQNFDHIFMQLGLVPLLSEVIKTASQKKVGKKGKKERTKFIQDVLADIGRFLEYKKKMIGF